MATYTGTWDHDNFVGTTGNDTFTNIQGGDTVDGGKGDDTISIDLGYTDIAVNYNAIAAATAAGAVPLQYMSVKNVEHLGTLVTGGGNDSLTISAAQGAFVWHAGAGTDTLKLDYSASTTGMWTAVTANGYETHLYPWTAAVVGLATDIERVEITGSQHDDALGGTAGNDILMGGAGDDLLAPGSGGKDVIDGGTGYDLLVDAYWGDTATTYDAVQAATATGFTVFNGTVVRNVESFVLTTGQGDDTVTVSAAQKDFTWIANGGTDRLVADYSASSAGITMSWLASTPLGPDLRIVSAEMAPSSNANVYSIESLWLTGSHFNDTIVGTAGDDMLNGNGGVDSIDGAAGNDTFVADYGTATTGITYDAVAAASAAGFTLSNGTSVKNVESFDLTTGSGDDTVMVNAASGAFIWRAGNGHDVLAADYSAATAAVTVVQNHTHFDTYTTITVAGVTANALDIEGLSITGSKFADSIAGTSGIDNIDGGAGADTMAGGLGDDYYYVDNAGDVVTEGVNAGNDTVISSLVSYTLTANVENLSLVSSRGGVPVAVSGTGNVLDNVISGNGNANTLYGLDGNDALNGGAGADTMVGGKGDDTYYVDNTGDVVTELANQGTDTVISSLGYALGANVENLTLTGNLGINGLGNDLNNVIIGNSASNVLSGGGGDDVLDGQGGGDDMVGGAGNDTYYVDSSGDVAVEQTGQGTDMVYASVSFSAGNASIEYITLTGTADINATGTRYANHITGNDGDNVIDGGLSTDTMAGGLGNDTYYVDNTGDKVVEKTGGGTDVVYASVSFNAGNQSIEKITLTGTDDLNATGNKNGGNVLTGNSGNNVLDGGLGADTLIGGLGNDTYVVDNTGDKVTEAANGGTDLVQSSISYALGANVENLTLTGTAAINGSGNSLANIIIGNSAHNVLNGGDGNDVLDGKGGADIMNGGLGNDTFYVDNAGDVIGEYANQGTDTVIASVTYGLAGINAENLTLSGTANLNATGNSYNNVLTGNAGNNVLTGGYGADTFVFTGGHDTITDFSAGQGDTLDLSAYHGHAHTLSQVGADTVIDFGNGVSVTVQNTHDNDAAFLSHIIW